MNVLYLFVTQPQIPKIFVSYSQAAFFSSSHTHTQILPKTSIAFLLPPPRQKMKNSLSPLCWSYFYNRLVTLLHVFPLPPVFLSKKNATVVVLIYLVGREMHLLLHNCRPRWRGKTKALAGRWPRSPNPSSKISIGNSG